MIRSAADSKELNGQEGPFIIISASGMCEAGRIVHHLKNNLADARTTVLFVGYCAENTLGWKLRDGHKEVAIFGEPVSVHARIEILDSFSGHADHSELIEYFHRITGPKKDVYLVHGEPLRALALQTALMEEYPDKTFTVAKTGQTAG